MNKATEDAGRLDSPLSDQLGAVSEACRCNSANSACVSAHDALEYIHRNTQPGASNMSKRTDWTIKQATMWVATHNETGETLVARTREALMSKIIEWERA